MNSPPSIRSLQDHKPLARADLLLLVSRLLGPPYQGPGPEDGAAWLPLAQAAATSHSRALARLLEKIQHQASTADRTAWMEEYARLFEGATACPVNETAYVRRDKGAILADICGFYRAFGFQISPAAFEKADHIRCELEFLAMLLVMATAARADNDPSRLLIAHGGACGFAQDHLNEWLPVFCKQLRSASRLALYKSLAAMLRLVWSQMRADLLLRTRRQVGFTWDSDDGSPYECGMAESQEAFVHVTVNGVGGAV